MAEENQTDSAQDTESSTKEELQVNGSEPPEGQEEKEEATQKADGKTDDTEDSELEGIFTDLEKDISEEWRPKAINVKKKLQGYLTKKTQSVAQKIKDLESNQITEDFKNDYVQLFQWYDGVRKNPVEGLRKLAQEMGVPLNSLITQAQKAAENELTPDKLETNEDFAKYVDQKLEPLRKQLESVTGQATQRELEERGARVLEEATKLPGFLSDDANGNKKLSKYAEEAILAVLKNEYIGPNALKNAFKAKMADAMSERVKELENKLTNLKSNVRGSTTLPGGKQNTTITPKSPEEMWSALRGETLSG